MSRFTTYEWEAPRGHRFRTVLSRSTYSVEITKDGQRVEFTGRKWGPSLTDALSMAGYTGDPSRALGGIAYLFNRIDLGFEGDRDKYARLFAQSRLIGPPGREAA